MATLTRNASEQYVRKVMSLIHAPEADRRRIEEDLRSHLQEGMAEGENMEALIERMGTPREVAAGFMAEIPLVYATFWERLAAFMLDMILIIVAAAIMAFVLVVISNALIPDHPVTTLAKIWGGFWIVIEIIGANAIIAMIIAYFPILEARFGKTLGKHLYHLRVCDEDGLPVTTWQALSAGPARKAAANIGASRPSALM